MRLFLLATFGEVMAKLVTWAVTGIYVLILGPLVVVILVGLWLGISAWLDERYQTRTRWRELQAQLRAGDSPVHRWVQAFPPGLFEGVLTLEAPQRSGRRRWRIGTCDGEPLFLARAEWPRSFALQLGSAEPEPPDGDGPFGELAQRVVERRIREPLAALAQDPSKLRGLIDGLDGLLWAPLSIAWTSLADDSLLPLYSAVEPFARTKAVLTVPDGAGVPERYAAWVAGLLDAGWDQGFPAEPRLPEGGWIAANGLQHLLVPAEDDLENPHWGDDPEEMEHLLFQDGRRTLEVQLNPYEGALEIGLHESPEAYLIGGVLPRLADELARRLARGQGWG